VAIKKQNQKKSEKAAKRHKIYNNWKVALGRFGSVSDTSAFRGILLFSCVLISSFSVNAGVLLPDSNALGAVNRKRVG
jgi:hypothetical protein